MPSLGIGWCCWGKCLPHKGTVHGCRRGAQGIKTDGRLRDKVVVQEIEEVVVQVERGNQVSWDIAASSSWVKGLSCPASCYLMGLGAGSC